MNREAERGLLAAFINGPKFAPGRQARLQMPYTVERALNVAIMAATIDKEETRRFKRPKDKGNECLQ